MRMTAAQRVERADRWRQTAHRAADCAAVGLLITLGCLPVVTAGAAWIAAARVFDAWGREEEPPLLATFVSTIRQQWRAGLILIAANLPIAALGYVDGRLALSGALPGARVEGVAVAVVLAAGVSLLLLTVAHRAHTGARLRDCARATVALVSTAPWTLAALVGGVATAALLVALVPAFVAVLGGPLGFAASAVYTRATADSAGPADPADPAWARPTAARS